MEWTEAELPHEGLQGSVADSSVKRVVEGYRAEQTGKEVLPAHYRVCKAHLHAPLSLDMWGPGSIHHRGERVYLPPELHQIPSLARGGQAAASSSICPCAGCSLKRCSHVCSEGEMAADKSYSQAISPKRPVKAAIAVLRCIHVLLYRCQGRRKEQELNAQKYACVCVGAPSALITMHEGISAWGSRLPPAAQGNCSSETWPLASAFYVLVTRCSKSKELGTFRDSFFREGVVQSQVLAVTQPSFL